MHFNFSLSLSFRPLNFLKLKMNAKLVILIIALAGIEKAVNILRGHLCTK